MVISVPWTDAKVAHWSGRLHNVFPEWSVVGTGNGNREQVGHGSVWSVALRGRRRLKFCDVSRKFLTCRGASESVFARFS